MKYFKDKIGSKYTPKRTKLHHFEKISRGGHAPNPIAKQISKSGKKFLAPLPNPGYAPAHSDLYPIVIYAIVSIPHIVNFSDMPYSNHGQHLPHIDLPIIVIVSLMTVNHHKYQVTDDMLLNSRLYS